MTNQADGEPEREPNEDHVPEPGKMMDGCARCGRRNGVHEFWCPGYDDGKEMP